MAGPRTHTTPSSPDAVRGAPASYRHGPYVSALAHTHEEREVLAACQNSGRVSSTQGYSGAGVSGAMHLQTTVAVPTPACSSSRCARCRMLSFGRRSRAAGWTDVAHGSRRIGDIAPRPHGPQGCRSRCPPAPLHRQQCGADHRSTPLVSTYEREAVRHRVRPREQDVCYNSLTQAARGRETDCSRDRLSTPSGVVAAARQAWRQQVCGAR